MVSERRGELLKATCIMSAREEKMDVTLAYLFLSPIPLSTFCSSREYSYPGEKTSSYLAKKTVLFFSCHLGKRANFAFMDHQKKHNAHCALSMYQRFAPSSATSKRMLASPELGTVLA